MREQTTDARDIRVALVEDDQQVRRSLLLLLRTRGFSVDVYRNGMELLSNRSRTNVDCLLVDYKMPQLNGLDLVRILRQNGDNTPALMITGFFSPTLRARALQVGFADVVEKSSEPQNLLDQIRAVASH